MKPVELRCSVHLHARLVDGVIEVRCRQCSKDQGRPVYHRWDALTGEPINDGELADKAA